MFNQKNIPAHELTQSDHSCLSKIADYYQLIAQSKFFCVIDLDYNVIAIDDKTLDIFKFTENIIGKNFLYDFERSPKRFHFARYNLMSCQSNKRIIKFLTVNKGRKIGYETLLYEYSPLVNNNTKNVVAILITAEVPSIPISFYKITQSFKDQGIVNRNIHDIKTPLSEREREVLFLLFHCRNKSEIAEVLSNIHGKQITESAIRKLIHRNLYSKFNVVNEIGLRNAIREYGFYLRIPDAISDEFIFNVTDL